LSVVDDTKIKVSLMGQEINLLKNYPKLNRGVADRGVSKTAEDQALAREFGRDFFDGSRRHGYGGFNYNERYWNRVIPDFEQYWDLSRRDIVLDVGCAKGFMLYDMQRLIPGIGVRGVDISQYAIDHAMEEVKEYCQVANATHLPFDDNSIDVSISITTLHNLDQSGLEIALQEIERVSKRGAFITLDAYRNNKEKERMEAWNLTAKTVMHVEDWKVFFKDVGYNGDYYWFIP